MQHATQQTELLSLFQQWALHFGYLSGTIDRISDDVLATFVTADCTLTSHAPLWGTKPGAERAAPVATVRKTLRGLLRYVKIERHDMHIAVHDKQLCIFFVVKGLLRYLPLFYIMKVPLAFVAEAVDTPHGLRMHAIHEWPAASPQAALRVLIEHHGWPETATFEKHVAFGAVS